MCNDNNDDCRILKPTWVIDPDQDLSELMRSELACKLLEKVLRDYCEESEPYYNNLSENVEKNK